MTSAAATSRSDSDAGPTSSDSKKRSKLGYHRTAVACSHCRRRKIRCVPSSDLPDAKCQNCIRLKKDCQFHPVDQQEAPPKKSRSGSKMDTTLGDADPMQASASPESSIDAPLSRVESNVGMNGISSPWDQSGFVNSPAHMNGYGFGPQAWVTQIPSNGQSPYQRHNSHPGQYYLPTEIASVVPYSQRQFVSMAPASIAPEPRPIYNNPAVEDTQYYDRRQSVGPAGNNGGTLQATSSNLYAASFSGPERRSTLPATYSGQQSQSGMQFQPEPGQYTLPSQFVVQHSQENLYNQNPQPQTYLNHRGIRLSENPRAYVKYPS